MISGGSLMGREEAVAERAEREEVSCRLGGRLVLGGFGWGGGRGGMQVHFVNEDLLGFGAEVAMYAGLDLEEVLDYVFEGLWR